VPGARHIRRVCRRSGGPADEDAKPIAISVFNRFALPDNRESYTIIHIYY
jgi:hypothetical protein